MCTYRGVMDGVCGGLISCAHMLPGWLGGGRERARAVSVAHVPGGARRRGREDIRERTDVSDIIGIA